MNTKQRRVVVSTALLCLSVSLIILAPLRPALFGRQLVLVEVADSPAERSRGLQFRETLPSWRGMLFVFEQDTVPSFWMKNTPAALSIAFLDARKRIVSIQDMEPLRVDRRYSPPVPVRFAVEMRQGWFQERGIKTGDRAWFW